MSDMENVCAKLQRGEPLTLDATRLPGFYMFTVHTAVDLATDWLHCELFIDGKLQAAVGTVGSTLALWLDAGVADLDDVHSIEVRYTGGNYLVQMFEARHIPS